MTKKVASKLKEVVVTTMVLAALEVSLSLKEMPWMITTTGLRIFAKPMEEARVQAFKILTIELAVLVGLVPFTFMITGILTLITRTKKQLK